MESLNEIISRRRFVALGAATGAAAAASVLPGAAQAAVQGSGQGFGSESGFTSAAPSTVNGAVMNSKGLLDFVALGVGSSTLQTNAGGTAVYSNNSAYGVVCGLDMVPGARLKRVDVYGLRSTTGAQTWNLKKVDATTGTTTLLGSVTVNGNGLLTGSITGLDIKVGGIERLFVDLPNATTLGESGAVGIVYQFVPPTTGLVLFGDDTDTDGNGIGDGNGGPISPVRVYDSRYDSARGKITKGQTRTVSVAHEVAHRGGRQNVVPVGARAIAYNVTCTSTEETFGFLSIAPAQVPPTFEPSSINWDHKDATIANGLIVAISPNREIGVLCDGGTAGVKTHFIVDITGYFI